MWRDLILQAGQLGIRWAAAEIRQMPARAPEGGGEAPGRPAAAAEGGCPACKPHRELAEARSLAEIMVRKADYQGRVPPHIASTVHVVRENLVTADRWAAVVAEKRPDLAGQCQDLRTRLAAEQEALPDRSAINRSVAQQLAARMTECWTLAGDLADDYWRPAPVDGELAAWVGDLTPAQRAGLARALAES